MPLKSYAFKDDPKLQACLVKDSAHVLLGHKGIHVRRIQAALRALDGAVIDPAELKTDTYGKSTAAAVLTYKRKRQIIAHSRQSQADDIVGKMTIEAMDKELLTATLCPPSNGRRCACPRDSRMMVRYARKADPSLYLLSPQQLAELTRNIA